MRRVLIVVLIMLGMIFAYAPKGLDTSNRPVFQQGIIKIRLTEQAMISKGLLISERKVAYQQTGIASIDIKNEQLQASNIKIALIEAKNKDLSKKLGLDRWLKLEIPMDADVMEAVELYKSDPNIDFAQPEYCYYIMAIPNDPYHANNWGHNNTAQLPGGTSHTLAGVGTVGFDANTLFGWDGTQGYGDPSIVIGIMDTGIDYDHPDLAAHYIGGYDFAMDDNDPDDNEGINGVSGHGTSCAGIAAGVINNGIGVSGVAGNCSIMALKVLNSSGSLVGMSDGAIWAGDNGVDILSMSYGSETGTYGSDPVTEAAYAYAYSSGVTLLAATGNGQSVPDKISSPSNHPDIIAVGAAAPDDGRKHRSSIDGETWWESNYSITTPQDDNNSVDIIAPTILPATDIVGTGGFDDGDYGMFFNGTSCATPYAAGFAALIKSKYPSYTPAQIRQEMVDTARDVVDEESSVGWDGYSGYGIIDIGEALGYVPTAPPGTSVLVSPSNGSTISDATPTFDWEDNMDASSYTILIDNDSGFGSPEVDETVTQSEYTPGSNLVEGTYYWKIQATNAIGSSAFTTAWNTSVSFPDINLSKSQVNTTAAPDATTSDSFDIENLGNFELSYNATFDYTGWPGMKADIVVEENDFESGLIYTNSGSWSVVSGEAKTTTQGISTLTSPLFDGSSASDLSLDFDHANLIRSGGYFQAEWNDGSTWTQVYNGTATTSGSEHITIPNTAVQVRFIANVTRSQGQTGWQTLDNVIIYGPPAYDWLTINGGETTSGTVAVSGSDAISVGCDATDLVIGLYTADITITSDDPDEPSKVLPVEFTVAVGGPTVPAVPANIVTSISGTDLIVDWDVSADATGYDVYSSDDPYGTFTLAASVGTNQYTVPADQAKLFYYIVATNSTK